MAQTEQKNQNVKKQFEQLANEKSEKNAYLLRI